MSPITDTVLNDALNELLTADPATAVKRLRNTGNVHRVPLTDGGQVWIVTRYEDVRALLADRDLSLSKRNSRSGYVGFGLPPALDANLFNLDAPDHTRLRALISGAFTPRRMEALADRLQARADELIDALPSGDIVDVLADFAAPLSVGVICDLLGIPEQQGRLFREWTSVLLSPSSTQPGAATTAMTGILGTLTALISHKRDEPADDLLSAMIAARDGADRLSEDELLSLSFLTLWAGYENSAYLITNALATLMTGPRPLYELVLNEPDPHTPAMRALVEELLRHDQPVTVSIRRFPLHDLAIGEVTIPAGDTVFLALVAANHDPDVFDAPEQIDPDRQPNQHLAFGNGPHYCLGAPLARLEARIALWTLIHRLPGLRLAVPADELRHKPDYRQNALLELPVAFTPATAMPA